MQDNTAWFDLDIYNTLSTFDTVFSKDKLHLLFIRKGVMYVNIDDKKLILTAISIFCFNGRENFAIQNKCNVEVTRLSFSPNVINSSFTVDNIHDIPSNFSKTDRLDCLCLQPFIHRTGQYIGQIEVGLKQIDKIDFLLKQIMDISENVYFLNKDFIYRSAILELLLIINQHSSKVLLCNNTMPNTDNSTGIEDVISYLHSFYSHNITIATITRNFNTNRTTLSKKFKEKLGVTPIDYLNRVRITKAALLLQESNMPINQIMIKVGFNNRNYFNKVFKKQTGLRPGEFRRNYRSIV
ncbi:transcriptional regulator, AraC family [Ruminiclostridium papyrosolvens DSM 2782]|uniref:Transcriptional regulator, AraC family n=1 Tax=Ruminiclostridium papyrosolvens DSM 2782 TaxID=588581 RepID=F1TCT7_9FIRM|nr:AraC family transcriptional regulator [Ruminiclostridium papyrosolvens]EGD47804.1 transcriptional regulator, AraC family [Ruminiclostridium papyrosolvens DSM 2782]WES34520.1 AraC family transcriptional regulator [Ruminiclostridium papyrosolvens DSM 2782]